MTFEQRLFALKQLMSDFESRLSLVEQQTATSERIGHLFDRQTGVFNRSSRLTDSDDQNQAEARDTEAMLTRELSAKGIASFCFKRVPKCYYKEDLDFRCNCLQAASIQHLCKSLLFENPKLPIEHESQEFRHYLVIVQYAAKLHGEKVKRFLHKTNGKLGIQYFRPRQADPEISAKLSGYESGSVTPVGLRTQMPLILSHEIDQLNPDFFWMGGGEQLLKLCMSVQDFKRAYKPYVVDCTY